VPFQSLGLHTADGLLFFAAEELSHQLVVVFVVSWVHLSGLVVLELRVLFLKAIRDHLTSKEPYTHDLKVGLFSEDTVSSEGILADVLGSGEESVHEIVCNMELNSLAIILVVVEEPEAPAFPVQHFVPLVNSFALLVGMVNVEGFEVVHVKSRRRQRLNVILLFLFNFLLSLHNRFWSFFLFFLLGISNTDGFKRLRAHAHVAHNLGKLRESVNSAGPFSGILHSLAESTVKDSLERSNESRCNDNVCS